MALTAEQAVEFLDTYGIEVPSFVLDAVLSIATSRDECLEANYPAPVVTLLQLYLLTLMGLSQGGRMVTSQRAVNGASRSFQYKTTGEVWKGVDSALRLLDTEGCLTDLIPVDPSQQAHVGLWVGVAGCMEGRR